MRRTKLGTWMGVGTLIGLGALQGPGCRGWDKYTATELGEESFVNYLDKGLGNCEPQADDVNQCSILQCVGDGGIEKVSRDAGTECTEGALKGECDGNGTCVVTCQKDDDCNSDAYCFNQKACVSCMDGTQNGDETGVDCGGSHCGKCNGDICESSGECQSGHCADGVCCNSDCVEECKSCDLEGTTGTCTNVPAKGKDESYTELGKILACGEKESPYELCNGNGACISSVNGTCFEPEDCFSGECDFVDMSGKKKCKGVKGDPCATNDLLCVSGKCVNTECAR